LGESVWEDTAVELPKECGETVQLKNVLDGTTVPTSRTGNRVTVRMADALAHFPVGLLTTAVQP
jgi:maltooligosyltrehalose synthase